jgi:hypothetical protein
LSDEFNQHMEARMKSKEGRRALNEWAAMIVDWASEQMPRDLLEGLASREGKKILEEIWPDIVTPTSKPSLTVPLERDSAPRIAASDCVKLRLRS